MKTTVRSASAASVSFLVLSILFGCEGNSSDGVSGGTEHVGIGKSDFVSSIGSRWISGSVDGGSRSDAGSAPSDETRIIEEGDIWKFSGDSLFVLNEYRGLQVFDLSAIDKPRLVSAVPLQGRPVEMYLRDGNAYVIVSSYFSDWIDPTTGISGEFRGSLLSIFDVKDPAKPKIIGVFNMPGDITDSRIVGEVMYLVSNRYSYYSNYPAGKSSSDNTNETLVYSINIAEPSDVKVAQMQRFEKPGGHENHVAVTESTIFIASPTYGYMDRNGKYRDEYGTRITLVDISDPEGRIIVGKNFMLDGFVNERWQMDYHDGMLRVVAPEHAWGNSAQNLFGFTVKNRDVVELAYQWEIPLPVNETLKSTRFDGDRAYVVTFLNKDPLFTIDLSNPLMPKLGAMLEMPGWLDFMEPRGDRLVALGHDNSSGDMTLAVSVFDVTDIKKPSLIKRVAFGSGWGFVPADKDDIQKVFKVMDADGLILVPFSGWSSSGKRPVNGVQLIDWDPTNAAEPVALRGMANTTGSIERAITFKNRLLAYSHETLQIIDIANRDRPVVTAALDLVRNVIGFVEINGFGVEASVPLYRYYQSEAASILSTVPLDNPGTETPIAKVAVDGYYRSILKNGNILYVISEKSTNYGQNTVVTALDYSDPATPKQLGMLAVGSGYYSKYFHVRLGAIAFMDYYSGKFIMADISNPADMKLAAIVDAGLQPKSYMDTCLAYAGNLFVSYRTEIMINDTYFNKYYFLEINLDDLYRPKVGKPVNVPGSLLGISADKRFVYTLDTQNDPPSGDCPDGSVSYCYLPAYNSLNVCQLYSDKAYLRATKRLQPGGTGDQYVYVENMLFNNGFAYYMVGSRSGSTYKNELYVADMTNSSRINIAARMETTGSGMTLLDGRLLVLSRYNYYSYYGTSAYGARASGLLLLDLENPSWPVYRDYVHANGHVGGMTLDGDSLYLMLGMSGVQKVELK